MISSGDAANILRSWRVKVMEVWMDADIPLAGVAFGGLGIVSLFEQSGIDIKAVAGGWSASFAFSGLVSISTAIPDDNPNSVVVKVEFGSTRLMLTGKDPLDSDSL